MKKSLLSTLISFSIVLLFSNSGISDSSLTGDPSKGETIFTGNCAACHANGKNVLQPEKTLEKEVLETNGMYSIDAIVTQVTNGKNAMPAFGGRLSQEDIENVASFVLNKSINWND
jgi:cytochrome c6